MRSAQSGRQRHSCQGHELQGSAPYLDMREWFADPAGELKAGKGCTLPLAGIPALYDALGQWLATHDQPAGQ